MLNNPEHPVCNIHLSNVHAQVCAQESMLCSACDPSSNRQRQCVQCRAFGVEMEKGLGFCDILIDFQTGGNSQCWMDIYIQVCELNVMLHRCIHLCSASQLWLPHPALCAVPPECFWDLRVWSRAVGSKSGKLWYIVDHDNIWLSFKYPAVIHSQMESDS